MVLRRRTTVPFYIFIKRVACLHGTISAILRITIGSIGTDLWDFCLQSIPFSIIYAGLLERTHDLIVPYPQLNAPTTICPQQSKKRNLAMLNSSFRVGGDGFEPPKA